MEVHYLALKSSGPKRPAAKVRVSRNAYRHGFAALTHRDINLPHDIDRLAGMICGDRKSPLLIAEARIVAENMLMLKIIVAEEIAAIERLRDIDVMPPPAQHEAIPRAKERGIEFERAFAELESLREAFDALPEEAREALIEEDAREVALLALEPARLKERDEVEAIWRRRRRLTRISSDFAGTRGVLDHGCGGRSNGSPKIHD